MPRRIRQLSEVPFEELKIGTRVKSLMTNRLGTIGALIPEDDCTIRIDWDPSPTSNIPDSYMYHEEAQYVALIAD